MTEHEIEYNAAKETVELAEALERLHDNEDFKQVILEHLFKDTVLTMNDLANNAALTPEGRAGAKALLETSAGLKIFFSGIYRQGDVAKRSLAEYEDEVEVEE